ncbi:hypothetical protein [Devosia sp. CAU 1758]
MRRHDQDQRVVNLRHFYPQSRELALMDDNGQFAAMARLIERRFAADLGDFLGDLVERPELAMELPAKVDPFEVFERHYVAGLVRIRRGKPWQWQWVGKRQCGRAV